MPISASESIAIVIGWTFNTPKQTVLIRVSGSISIVIGWTAYSRNASLSLLKSVSRKEVCHMCHWTSSTYRHCHLLTYLHQIWYRQLVSMSRVTSRWMNPRWEGMVETVVRSRVKTPGDLRVGMIVQVAYKSCRYKATLLDTGKKA